MKELARVHVNPPDDLEAIDISERVIFAHDILNALGLKTTDGRVKKLAVYGNAEVIEEIKVAPPDWKHWPIPPPPEAAHLAGQIWELTFRCAAGDEWTRRETKMYDEPIKPLFGG